MAALADAVRPRIPEVRQLGTGGRPESAPSLRCATPPHRGNRQRSRPGIHMPKPPWVPPVSSKAVAPSKVDRPPQQRASPRCGVACPGGDVATATTAASSDTRAETEWRSCGRFVDVAQQVVTPRASEQQLHRVREMLQDRFDSHRSGNIFHAFRRMAHESDAVDPRSRRVQPGDVARYLRDLGAPSLSVEDTEKLLAPARTRSTAGGSVGMGTLHNLVLGRPSSADIRSDRSQVGTAEAASGVSRVMRSPPWCSDLDNRQNSRPLSSADSIRSRPSSARSYAKPSS
eukprot:TRINITY_DN55957_c0_g1_i1.p1 TRINITY_DN55957_c0_g1~~TRINITY_DN55957_c0_g1_i1.p1  ORF type:complete len:307 (-),score=21.04 TRINITY_DN55957_c0_g1_i1:211-1071(-)